MAFFVLGSTPALDPVGSLEKSWDQLWSQSPGHVGCWRKLELLVPTVHDIFFPGFGTHRFYFIVFLPLFVHPLLPRVRRFTFYCRLVR